MKLSIVTITYNNYLELKNTLSSISGLQNIESVIINGGSCQETLNFLKQHPEWVSVSGPDEGISDAFNKGIQRSTGDAVTFLNSGDLLIDKSYYQKALNILSENQQVDYVYANIIFKHKEHGELIVSPHLDDISKTPFPHPSLIARKKVFDEIGGFDKNLKIAMDYDFMIRLLVNKYKGFYYQDDSVVFMDGTGISSNQAFRAIDERVSILKKYNQMTFDAFVYFKILQAKNHARNVLKKMNLLQTYDKIKKKFSKIKSE